MDDEQYGVFLAKGSSDKGVQFTVTRLDEVGQVLPQAQTQHSSAAVFPGGVI